MDLRRCKRSSKISETGDSEGGSAGTTAGLSHASLLRRRRTSTAISSFRPTSGRRFPRGSEMGGQLAKNPVTSTRGSELCRPVHFRLAPVDGSELARAFFTRAALVGAAMEPVPADEEGGSRDRWP